MDSFIHIPKVGGSTIRTILARQYGIEHILYHEPSAPWWDSRTASRGYVLKKVAQDNIALVTGHEPFGLHELLWMPCRTFSMVRAPVQRAISEYFYAFSYKHHIHRDEILSGRLSFEDFLAQQRFAGDSQARMLAGLRQSEENVLAAARYNARHSLVVVGIQDRFDESILLFAKILRWAPPFYVSRNVTKLERRIEERREQIEAQAGLYEKHFIVDIELYNDLNSALSKRISEEGAEFQAALDAFREIQADLASTAGEEVFDAYEFRALPTLPAFICERYADSGPMRIIDMYLSRPPSAQPASTNYAGHYVVLETGLVVGWAMDLSRGEPIYVSIYRDGTIIGAPKCSRMRSDVQADGAPRSNVGFQFDLGRPARRDEIYVVCFEGSPIQLSNS